MSNIIKKILVILLLAIIFISNAYNIVHASFEISDAYIEKIGDINYHLKYYKEEKGMYTYCTCAIVGYRKNGKFYPAYCLNRDLHGVGAVDSYTVDVDSLLDNNQVWRAVKNGYPYKSAQEMGLNSDFDAFAVTKFAIYCLIGQADVNLYTADEEDSEGQAMLSQLHHLIEIGKNGKETYNDELKIIQDKELTEEGDYYAVTYKVIASSNISHYDIKSISGLSEGDLLTDEQGNIKTSFDSREKFKIKIPKTNLNSNRDIHIEIEGNLKTYPMFYGKTRIAGTQNYLLTANYYQDIHSQIDVRLQLNTGKIIVNKKDDETKKGIEGVTFELYNSKNELIQKKETNIDGIISFNELFPGQYKLKETSTNKDYILEENKEFNIKVNYNKTSNIEIENKHKKGNLTIYKVDKDNNNLSLGNVGFELYSSENSNLIGTYYTDADGKIQIKDLRTGIYSLKEISTNQWYNLAEDIDLEIKWDETSNITVEDELKKGRIRVIKVDMDNHEIRLPNVEFEVLDTNNNILEKIITNENGEAVTKEYALRDYKNIRLHEIHTDNMYELNDEIKEVTLEENQIKDIIFENRKIQGKVKIIKTSKEFNKITGVDKDTRLEGVKFEIYDNDGNVIDVITTNSEGIALSKDLPKGKYKLKEIETQEWYILDDKYYEFEIKNNEQIIELNLQNMPKNPDEEVKKVGPDVAQKGEEIEYKINIQNSGNVALDNFILEEQIPSNYLQLTKIKLGTYNQTKNYNVYYKTNFTNDYILLLEDITTNQIDEIDFSKELAENEYITAIKFDFGTVNIDFKNNSEICIFAKVKDNVRRNDIIENRVTLTGQYKGHYLTKDSKCKTKVYEILPLTGM